MQLEVETYKHLANVCDVMEGWAFLDAFNARLKDQTDTTWRAYVYVLDCADGTEYVGFTRDPEKRMIAHSSRTGANYTKTRLPVRIKYLVGIVHDPANGWEGTLDETSLDRHVKAGKPIATLNQARIDRLNALMVDTYAKITLR